MLVSPTAVRAQVLLDRLSLRDGSVVVGKILSDSASSITLFSTRMREEVVASGEVHTYEKIQVKGNPFKPDPSRPFYCSVITTVRTKDGKEFRGVSLDRQGDAFWLITPEGYLLKIPFVSVLTSIQEPIDVALRGRPVSVAPPPESWEAAPPAQETRPAASQPVVPSSRPAPAPTAQALSTTAAAAGVPPPLPSDSSSVAPAQYYGGIFFGIHDQSSGPLEEFYGTGVSFGGFAGFRIIPRIGGRIAIQYFSKAVMDPQAEKWQLTKLPIEAALTVHPFQGWKWFEPYVGLGPGITRISQEPDAFVLEELKREESTSQFVPHYFFIGGSRIRVWQDVGAFLELRYANAPFEDQSHNLNAGGVDFLMGMRWR